MKRLHTYITCVLLTLSSVVCFAAERDTLSISVYFRQGESRIDPGYRGNRMRLDAFVGGLEQILRTDYNTFQAVSITTGASPEGSTALNEKLSLARARAIRDFVLGRTTLTPSQVRVYSRGADWDGLADAIRQSSCPWKAQALSIIYDDYGDVSADIRNERRKARLKEVDDRALWNWIETYLFEDLRSARGSLSCVMSSPSLAASRRDTLYIISSDTLYIASRDTLVTLQMPGPMGQYGRKATRKAAAATGSGYYRRDSLFRIPAMAFRSNLLLPLLNVGVEVPVGNRVSLGADFYYPWAMRKWLNGPWPTNLHCMQALAASAECRIWLGAIHGKDAPKKYRLCGHSIGIVAAGGYYDVELNGEGQQGEFATVGIEYNYSLPVGKGGVHFDFNIGAGYCLDWYRNYHVPQYGEYHLIGKDSRRLWQGPVPVKCAISLVVPVFRTTKQQ